ncbi:hypothetical protein AB0L05_25785 [Nonomuraea pusilla]|uniref:hypothetical protein n=1 Tax=Nonomuraea pusilla TaxID=46177 RepID=UPI003323E0BB
MAVLQPRRVACEGARVFVAAAPADAYWWLSEAVGRYLGLMYQLQLCETRLRLQAEEDARFPETAAWRARLDQLLDATPAAAPLLAQLAAETASRMSPG